MPKVISHIDGLCDASGKRVPYETPFDGDEAILELAKSKKVINGIVAVTFVEGEDNEEKEKIQTEDTKFSEEIEEENREEITQEVNTENREENREEPKKEIKLKCDICGHIVNSRQSLYMHKKRKHGQ